MKFSIEDLFRFIQIYSVSCGFGHIITEEILNGKLHFMCSVCFTSFIIFILKATSMYFALTYCYYTNLYASSETTFKDSLNLP